jgi:predicted permease
VTNDIRFALRTLIRNPTFGIVAVLTLALGIGANAALFSVADAVLLKPLPYPEPDRIVEIEGAPFRFTAAGMTVAPAMTASTAFAGVGLWAIGGLNLAGEPGAERVRAAAVTPGFFAALGSHPAIGRTFTDADLAANPRVAVISDALWRRRFGADPAIGEKPVLLNGSPYVVFGVMPARFSFPGDSDAWIPSGADRQITGSAFAPTIIARLAPGVTAVQARDEVVRINQAASRGRGDASDDEVTVQPLRETVVAAARPLVLIVWAAVVLVLLVACINTANLLLARVTAREREIAIRRALGASRARVVRQLLTESAILSALAGLVAAPAAWWTLHGVRAVLPADMHGAADVAFDVRALAATAALCVAATALFALAPALSARGAAGVDVLRAAASTTNSRLWRRFRSGLVVAEIGIALLLLAGAATIVRTVSALMRTDLGAHGERALLMQLTLPRAKYAERTDVTRFYDLLDERVRAVPGVEAVGASTMTPGSREVGIGIGIAVEGADAPAAGNSTTDYLSATPQYFGALGIDVVAGRTFEPADRDGAPPVVVVSEAFGRAVGLEPAAALGRRVNVNPRRTPAAWATIVGVVRGVRMRGPDSRLRPQIYLPYAQQPSFGTMYVAVRAAGNPRTVAPAIRAAVADVDPDMPPYNLRTFDEVRAGYIADRRFAMALMIIFGGLAAVLAAIGLYGVIAYLVQLRSREIGIRMALGATPASVGGQVLRGGLLHAALGIAVGAALAAAASRFAISRIPGLQRIDATTLVTLAVVMVAFAAVTTWIPARRATRIDPIRTLRMDA